MDTRFIFTVAELNRHIKDSLEPLYTSIWVEGEISNLRIPASGHCYFTLKDSASQIRAVVFRLQNRFFKFTPEDGLKVICRGRINVYEPRGEYQLLIETIEPRGIGELQLAFEQLKKRLLEEGLFDSARKKPLPLLPGKIAVITSPTGAAVRDIIHIIHRRFPNIEILVVPVKVQGDEAPDEIIQALKIVNDALLADVLILGRGGGSLEDLWAFNTEKVARAISASKIPVISAVGHEIDFTIADFVADLRAPTPSAAAELVVKEKKELSQSILHLSDRLSNAVSQYIERGKEKTRYAQSHLTYPAKKITDYHLRHDDLYLRLMQTLPRLIKYKNIDIHAAIKIILSHAPLRTIQHNKKNTANLAQALASTLQTLVHTKAHALESTTVRLHALNPSRILERGFSITRLVPSMKIITDAGELKNGDAVEVTLSKGSIDCQVKRVLH